MQTIAHTTASKLRMIGKNVIEVNDFAFYTQESQDEYRIYKFDENGKLDKDINRKIYAECEVRKHFILAYDTLTSDTGDVNYRPHLWVKNRKEDLLAGYPIRYLEFDINKELPVIGVACYLRVLIINEFGEIRDIDMVGKRDIGNSIPIGIDRARQRYIFYNRHFTDRDEAVDKEIASWSFDYKTFREITPKLV